jgi:hypothetical protein
MQSDCCCLSWDTVPAPLCASCGSGWLEGSQMVVEHAGLKGGPGWLNYYMRHHGWREAGQVLSDLLAVAGRSDQHSALLKLARPFVWLPCAFVVCARLAFGLSVADLVSGGATW